MTEQTPYVLLCEDDENDAFLFELEWRRAGFALPLRVMSNAEKVLDLLGRCKDEGEHCPALIISDHKLMVGGGMDILAFVRSTPLFVDIPVILTSGVVDANTHAKALSLGALDVWEKPASPEDLARLAANMPALLRS
ncbi:MAG TPA: response regulator [Candidatus Saccharimonadales bacterium]|nr:response regulator [Candidatus Saccharimonadales bacterium]